MFEVAASLFSCLCIPLCADPLFFSFEHVLCRIIPPRSAYCQGFGNQRKITPTQVLIFKWTAFFLQGSRGIEMRARNQCIGTAWAARSVHCSRPCTCGSNIQTSALRTLDDFEA